MQGDGFQRSFALAYRSGNWIASSLPIWSNRKPGSAWTIATDGDEFNKILSTSRFFLSHQDLGGAGDPLPWSAGSNRPLNNCSGCPACMWMKPHCIFSSLVYLTCLSFINFPMQIKRLGFAFSYKLKLIVVIDLYQTRTEENGVDFFQPQVQAMNNRRDIMKKWTCDMERGKIANGISFVYLV